MEQVFALISAAAFLAVVLSVALFPRVCGETVFRGQIFGCLLLLPPFLFVPLFSLPAFVCLKYSALVMALLAVCAVRQSSLEGKKQLVLMLLTALSFSLLIFLLKIARDAGAPGVEYSLDLICTVNLRETGIYVLATAVLAAAAFLCCAGYCALRCDGLFQRLYVTLCCAISVCLVFPRSFAGMFGLCGAPLFITDFICFWAIVWLLKSALLKISARR